LGCCHHDFANTPGGDEAFAIDASRIVFGAGCLKEAGEHARALNMHRVAVFTDRGVRRHAYVGTVTEALAAAGIDHVVYDEVKVEPTDASFRHAARFAAEGRFDGFVSVGGGSVIDTCKAANLYSSHPADFLAYVNAPIGAGRAVPGPLKPHIACPTTCGTGSEVTGVAVFDLSAQHLKTGISSKLLKPSLALVDPAVAVSLPATVVAASGFDALSHALEAYTALPYTRRAKPANASLRPVYQGANPWSDALALEALASIGAYLVRAVRDAKDAEARTEMMYAGTLAGIAFGSAGCHIPHGMSYAVAGLVREYRAPEYPQDKPMVPHGMAVILNAPSVYRWTAPGCPDRHLRGAQNLGADTRGATPEDAGEIVASRIIEMMQATLFPAGLGAIGFGEADVSALAAGAFPQQRLLTNSPRPVGKDDLAGLFRGAMRYW
jgi:hydroxyacid-oxoacid transhydrogenase